MNFIQFIRPLLHVSTDHSYREAFERLWDASSEEVVPNSQPEHAAALLSVFFERAVHSVNIFSKRLNGAVYDRPELLNAAKKAVERGIFIQIIVQEAPSQDSEFFQFIRDAHNPDGSSPLLNTGKEKSKIPEIRQNFAFVDERAFRFEESNHEVVAFASAYSPKTVKILEDFFTTLKAHLTSLNVAVTA